MKKFLRLIKYCFTSNKKLSLLKSMRFTFFSKHVSCDKNSYIFVSKKSKIILLKDSKISISNGSLYIINSFADVDLGSTLKLNNNARLQNIGLTYLYGACINLWHDAQLTINNNIFNAFVKLNIEKRAYIGEKTMFARGCYVADTDSHSIVIANEPKLRQKDLSIGKNVWVGVNSVILKGVSIGDNVIVGAGTVIARNISSNNIITTDIKYKEKEFDTWIF